MADLAKINYETVRNLELLVPSVEVSSLNSLVSSGQVLSEFSPVQRKQILLRLRSFDDRIPSLFSFFEDFKCFEKWAHCVHRLFELNGHTVRQRMDREWRPRSFYIETGENAYSEGSPAGSDGFDLAYRQIWLFAMRHYPDIPQSSKKEPQYVGSLQSEVDENILANMAKLASKLGFQSSKIHDLLERSPDHLMAKQALLKARKKDQFSYDEHIFESLVERVVECFNAATPKSHDISERQQLQTNRKHRCGHPVKSQFLSCSRSFFLARMHWDWLIPANVTALLVQRSIYLAFFGPLSSGPNERCIAKNQPGELLAPDGKAYAVMEIGSRYEGSSRFYDAAVDSMMNDIIDQEALPRSAVDCQPPGTFVTANNRDGPALERLSNLNAAEDTMMNDVLDEEASPPRATYPSSSKTLHEVPSRLNTAQEGIIYDVHNQEASLQIPKNHLTLRTQYEGSSPLHAAEDDMINSLLEQETSLHRPSSAKSLQNVSQWNIPASPNQYSRSEVSSSYKNQQRAQTLHQLQEQSGFSEPLLPGIMQHFRSQGVPESIITNNKSRPLSSYSERSWETPSMASRLTDDKLSKGRSGEIYHWETGRWHMVFKLSLDDKESVEAAFERYQIERYQNEHLLIFDRNLRIVSKNSIWRALKQEGILLLIPRKLRSDVGRRIKAPF
ncbi:hypothetical protein N7533_008354 [Penicillium manginii]|uniref:uncharacterized protein n=1 Tax=Penicillium manginii TaxID=203109 RepID=UPI0025466EB8|nr:uncharacterized protein N7533_008354 [Penicillium manginii]KAJ5751326.1 hypothetical protein N7533_008354 [Penicillium manginii]